MSKGDIEQEAEVKPGRPATARQVCAMALVFIALAGGVLLAIRRATALPCSACFFVPVQVSGSTTSSRRAAGGRWFGIFAVD